MAKSKIIKAGTTVRMHYSCTFAGCDGYDSYTLEDDMTEEELNEMAMDMAIETIQTEGWFELADEEDDE